jgi:sugar lactone lactonase YvrE
VKLVEWVDGRAVPYPDAAAQAQFLAPLGVRIDRQNRLWVLDHGRHGLERARLVAFDLASGTITKEVVFDREAAPIGSFLNDLVVDPAGETVYISDASFFRKSPAIVVLDVANGSARRVLEKHRSVVAENWTITTPSRTMVLPGGLVALRAGVGGITLSGDGEWLYYGAMNHAHAFRVRAADVRSRHLNAPALAATAERISAKPLSDGMTTDVAGNLLITDVEHGAILRFRTNGRLETLVRSLRIRWADGLSFGPDGWLYIADSALPDVLLRSKDQMRIRAPYHIYRFRPDTLGVPGQ